MAANPDIESQTSPMGISLKDASRDVRLGFVRKVYSILGLQLLVTTGVAVGFHFLPLSWIQMNSWVWMASFAGTLVSMIAICCCPSVARTFPVNYLLLVVFTLSESVLLGIVSAQYTAGTVGLSAGVTAAVFLCMTVYAWRTKSDFTGAGPYLMGFLFALVAFGLGISILMLFGVETQLLRTLYAGAAVLLFTMYIVYDTQLILGELGGHRHSFDVDDYIFAALSLYIDIVNLFLNLLSLMGSQRSG